MTNQNLRSLLSAAGLTQTRAAEFCHVDLRTMQRWVAGESEMPGAAWELLQIRAGVFIPEMPEWYRETLRTDSPLHRQC